MRPYVRHASGTPFLPFIGNCKDFLTPSPPFLPYVIYEQPLKPQPKNTFYDVQSVLLHLGSKQVKCPNTTLEERVL